LLGRILIFFVNDVSMSLV